MAFYWDSFTSCYVDDVRTSQETHLLAPTACYGDSFTSCCVDDVHTSQEAHLWSSTSCYGDGFTSLYADNVVRHRKNTRTAIFSSK
jgi:hypothetical protein